MASGQVIRFDSMRGYGFIASGGGGDDIFLHVNELQIPEAYLRPGLAVEFEVEDGDRGPKASNIRLAGSSESAEPTGIPQAATGTADAKEAANGEYPMCDVLSAEDYTRDVTELLLRAAPSLTGDQILQLRHELVKFSESHGWIEG
ncbi:cold-shock protein [Streptomyces phaeochromogenes]|uniref:cold-shock protein n=1 Tax=Streptomyces phaeochromogenes TaxID=1923 RepID=UPI00340E67C6